MTRRETTVLVPFILSSQFCCYSASQCTLNCLNGCSSSACSYFHNIGSALTAFFLRGDLETILLNTIESATKAFVLIVNQGAIGEFEVP